MTTNERSLCPSPDAKEDFRETLIPSLVNTTSFPVACVEYRLAPIDPHPAQVLDVLSALSLLQSPLLPAEGDSPRWDRRKIYLVGHSAGAFMASTIVLKSPPSAHSSFSVPTLVRLGIKGIICVDGIFDLPDLLEEYPTYDYFVKEAFGEDPKRYEEESPIHWGLFPAVDDKPSFFPPYFILHSKEDELMSDRQTKGFVAHLKGLIGEEKVDTDYEGLRGTHEGLLKLPELAVLVKSWVDKNESRN